MYTSERMSEEAWGRWGEGGGGGGSGGKQDVVAHLHYFTYTGHKKYRTQK